MYYPIGALVLLKDTIDRAYHIGFLYDALGILEKQLKKVDKEVG